jgi:hypothetical protein
VLVGNASARTATQASAAMPYRNHACLQALVVAVVAPLLPFLVVAATVCVVISAIVTTMTVRAKWSGKWWHTR